MKKHPQHNQISQSNTPVAPGPNFNPQPFKNYSVRIYSNIKNQSSKTQWIEIGKYYPLQKNYFYKQKLLLFIILNFTFSHRMSSSSKIQMICENFLQFFAFNFTQNHENQSRQCSDSKINENLIESQYLRKVSKIKLENIFKEIKQKQKIVDVENQMSLKQVQILLQILLKKWVSNQNSKRQFYKSIQSIFKQKISFQTIQNSNKITHLRLVAQNSNENKLLVNKNQLLYKNLNLKIGKQVFSNIIETNQQKYIFFKIENIQIDKLTKITDLFDETQKQILLQSQDQKSSDKNSEIVKDQQFYRISSKISTSCRKNSFNSGQKLPSENDQKDLQSKDFFFQSNYPRISAHKINCPTSQVYTRSSSFQKGNLINKDLYTSIDLFMKLQSSKDQMNYKRKKSCENPRFKEGFSTQASRHFNKISSKIKINLIDQSKAHIFSQNFKSYQSCLPSNFPFLRLNKKQQENPISQNKIGVIRNFFKQNLPTKE